MNTQKFGLNRFQWILTGALAVQIILAIVINLPPRTQASGGPLLDNFDPASIVDIVLENQTSDQIHMAKESGQWVLPEAGDYPVMGEKVTEMLEKIKNIQTNRLVTQTKASHDQLQVADDNFMNRIFFTEASGKTKVLYLGSSGGAGATHIRLVGSNQVYLTGELSSWEIAPTMNTWIDTTYVTLPEEQIQALIVQNANGTFNFIKGEDGTWGYAGLGEGETFDANTFQSTINRLAALQMLAPLGIAPDPSMGFDQPTAVATIQLVDEAGTTSTTTIAIGGVVSGDTNYAAKASSSPYYVKIAAFTAKALVEMDHTSLLVQQEPTPAP